jgi:hypothetical protein
MSSVVGVTVAIGLGVVAFVLGCFCQMSKAPFSTRSRYTFGLLEYWRLLSDPFFFPRS